MSYGNTKYTVNAMNFAVNAACVLCNNDPDTYPGAPDPITGEDANNPMTNALTWDRRAVCRVPDGQTGDVYFDIDLGANRAVKAVGIMGMLKAGTSAFPGVWQAYYIANPTYNPANFVQFIAVQSWTAQRDLIMELGAQVNSVRYVRFRFFNASLADWFEVGKFFVGSLTDLGIMYTPGSGIAPLLARSRVETVDGAPWTAELGPTRKLLPLIFNRASTTLKNLLYGISTELKPFLLQIASSGEFVECIPVQDGFSCAHIWGVTGDPTGATDRWDVQLEVEGLY